MLSFFYLLLQKIIRKLKGQFVNLAQDKHGARSVEALFAAAEVTAKVWRSGGGCNSLALLIW